MSNLFKTVLAKSAQHVILFSMMRPELQSLRKKYEAELAETQKQFDAIKAKIQAKIQVLDEVGSDLDNGSLNFNGPDYSQTGLKAATLDALEKLNAGQKPVTIPELAMFLRQHRYPHPDSLSGGLNTTLKRLTAAEGTNVHVVGHGRRRKFQLVKDVNS